MLCYMSGSTVGYVLLYGMCYMPGNGLCLVLFIMFYTVLCSVEPWMFQKSGRQLICSECEAIFS